MSKNCLIIYGQLRTFKICIDNLLNYIDYENITYDVFLFLDICMQYNKDNINLLKEKLTHKNINSIHIFMIHDIIDIDEETKSYNFYFDTVNEIKKTHDNISSDKFVSKLYYRRLRVLQYMNQYMIENNLTYNKCIFTRFDINLKDYISSRNNNILLDKQLYIAFDVLFIGTINDLLNIFNFSNNIFSIYNCYKLNGKEKLYEFIDKIDIENFDKFFKKWVCMPEYNFIVYLKINGINFNKLNYYNIIQR
jgi:hypothetical protein